jgi:hypothetical protein
MRLLSKACVSSIDEFLKQNEEFSEYWFVADRSLDLKPLIPKGKDTPSVLDSYQ